jgi:hypothetical protein
VGAVNSWTIDLDRDKEDVTCFGDTNKQYVLGLANVEGEIKGVWDEDLSPDLIRVALGDVPVMLELVPSTITATHKFKGLAYLSAGLECPADGAVTMSGTWVAAGPWTLEPAAA